MAVLIPVLGMLLMAAPHDGKSLYHQRQFTAAEQVLRRTLARNPDDHATRLYLARTLLELKRNSEALAELERILSRTIHPEIRFQAGRILRDLAEDRFSRLQAVAPGSAATLELAGARLEWTGNLDEALEKYRAAEAVDPKRPGIQYRIGNILWLKRELEAAAERLRRELALNPDHGMANLRMGSVHLSAGRDADAIPFLERAVTALPDSVEARRELGKAYRKTGRPAEARRAWEAVAKARPDDDQVHYLLSGLYRELGETALAQRELELHRALLSRRRERR